jgi:hypothetical protein
MPTVKVMSHSEEMSLADLDRQVFINWGRKAIVVQAPATKPKIVTKSIKVGAKVDKLAVIVKDNRFHD